MNPKFVNKINNKKIPFRISFTQKNVHSLSGHTISSTSKLSSINNVIKKPISTEEYNRVLIQNQRLAKENAFLKSQSTDNKESIRLLRSDSIELKQQLSAANTLIEELQNELKNNSEINKISDQIKTAVSLLIEEYLTIDAIKHEINQLGETSQTVRGIMSSLQSLIDSNNQLNESQGSEQNSERIESFFPSVRYSSQEMDLKRRLSSERIRRDFHILNELSTIFEMSNENRISSLTSNEINGSKNTNETVDNIHKETTFNQNLITTDNTSGKTSTNASNVITSDDKNPVKTNAIQRQQVFNRNIVTTDTNSMSSVSTSEKDLESKKPKRKTKKEINTETNIQKKSKVETKPKNKNEKSVKTENNRKKGNDSMVYEFNEDDENKENIYPIKLAQRFSKRVRNKRFSLERI